MQDLFRLMYFFFFLDRNDELNRKPIAYLVCNQSPPVGDTPSLMTFREVTTLFHEVSELFYFNSYLCDLQYAIPIFTVVLIPNSQGMFIKTSHLTMQWFHTYHFFIIHYFFSLILLAYYFLILLIFLFYEMYNWMVFSVCLFF